LTSIECAKGKKTNKFYKSNAVDIARMGNISLGFFLHQGGTTKRTQGSVLFAEIDIWGY
jgi:hypothetical protein